MLYNYFTNYNNYFVKLFELKLVSKSKVRNLNNYRSFNKINILKSVINSFVFSVMPLLFSHKNYWKIIKTS